MRITHILIAALVGFGSPLSAQAYGGQLFYCGEAGDAEIHVEFDLFDPSIARHYVTIPGGYGGPPSITELKQVPGTPNPVYAADDISLSMKGAGGTLNDVLETFECALADRASFVAPPQSVPLADMTWTEQAIDKPGKSWAGVLRAGPGMDYDKVASLELDQAVTLIARTDQKMDEFTWYKIELPNGMVGYKWGGILCDPSGEETGTYNEDGCIVS